MLEEDGSTLITIISTEGAYHALQTFSQLFFAQSKIPSGIYSHYAPVKISDSPNFEHRGLNLDISRNWIPPAKIMRTIEALAASKLNRLHLHASDAQSWPLEVPALLDLAAKGAYSPSEVWSTTNFENVQPYGHVHGVEVYLEIDLPGHTRAIEYSYPELVVAADKEPCSEYALQPLAGQLKLNSSNVTRFLSTLLHDLLPRSSPWSSKFHNGGDELNTHVYELDSNVRSSSTSVLQPLLQAFVDHIISVVVSHGIPPLVWKRCYWIGI